MPKIREGKTKREHESGVHSNRFENRRKRVAWEQDSGATNTTFPREACNGKRNRHRYTAKGNVTHTNL